jgi:multidrug efflux system membrane fusion protein
VYVVDKENLAHRRNVTIGYEDDLGSVVTSGIEPGEQIVVDGASRLTDGAKVSVVSPDTEVPSTDINRPTAPGTRPSNGRGG